MYSQGLLDAFIEHSTYALVSQQDHVDIHCFFWLRNLSRRLHSLEQPALRASVAALAAAGLGQATKDDNLIQGATTAYNSAVERLSGFHVANDDEAFAACLTLVMYQYFAATPDRQHLYVHTSGLSAMLQSRGPDNFKDGLAHDLFASCRSVLVASSLNSRKAIFISNEAWRTIPWSTRPKSSYESMLDCLSFIPQIGQDFQAAQQRQQQGCGSDIAWQQNMALLTDLWGAISMLRAWFLSVVDRARPTGVVYTHESYLLDPAPLILTFPRSYEYRSLAASNMCRLFWTALTDLYNMLALTYESLAQHGIYSVPADPVLQSCRQCVAGDQTTGHNSHYFCTAGAADWHVRPLPSIDAGTSNSVTLSFACRLFARTAAEQVCMSLQYCLSPQHGTVGKYLCIIPVKFAVWCFTINLPASSYQREWARRVVRMLADSGVPFSAQLFNDKPYMRNEDSGMVECWGGVSTYRIPSR